MKLVPIKRKKSASNLHSGPLEGRAEVKGQPLMMLCCSLSHFLRTVGLPVDRSGRSTGRFQRQLLRRRAAAAPQSAAASFRHVGSGISCRMALRCRQMECGEGRCLLGSYRTGRCPLQSRGISHSAHGFHSPRHGSANLRGSARRLDKVCEKVFFLFDLICFLRQGTVVMSC